MIFGDACPNERAITIPSLSIGLGTTVAPAKIKARRA
jgi:hypothetical protein